MWLKQITNRFTEIFEIKVKSVILIRKNNFERFQLKYRQILKQASNKVEIKKNT